MPRTAPPSATADTLHALAAFAAVLEATGQDPGQIVICLGTGRWWARFEHYPESDDEYDGYVTLGCGSGADPATALADLVADYQQRVCRSMRPTLRLVHPEPTP
jgi:hypothetical protein